MEDSLLRQRRNLISISIGLIILELGGGKFNVSGSLFGGSVTFENTFVLTAALWIGLVYFLWRFWIFGGRNVMVEIRQDYMTFICDDLRFKKTLINEERKNITQRFSKIQPNCNIGEIREPKITWSKSEKGIELVSRFPVEINGGNQLLNLNKTIKATDYIDVFIRCIIGAIFKKEAFSDYALPLFLAFSAILLNIL